MRITHVTLDFCARGEGRDGVHNDDIDRSGSDKGLDNLERLLTRIGLRDPQFVRINTQVLCVRWIKSVFGVDKSSNTTLQLCLGDSMKRKSCFPGSFRTVYLDYPSSWISPYSKSCVE